MQNAWQKLNEKLKKMQRETSLVLLLVLIVAAFLMSFQDSNTPKTIDQLLEEAVRKKTDRYRNIRIKKCEDRIMKEAGERADSIIISRAKALKVIQDTMSRPNAPDRPARPDLLEPIDSSSPVPLLEEGKIQEIEEEKK